MAIGERIRFIRNLRGMTQKLLGTAIGFPEKTADIRLAQYESGTRTPKEDITVALANDAFAFIKPSMEISFSLSKPVGSYAFSKALQNSGIIENPFSFWLYTKHRHAESYIENFHGTIDLNSSMSYRELIQQFKNFQIS